MDLTSSALGVPSVPRNLQILGNGAANVDYPCILPKIAGVAEKLQMRKITPLASATI